jgi:hypothetical protein
VLVVIGPRWLTIADEQNRARIQLPDDVHHQEIAFVLGRSDVTVIPVLVDEALMPHADQLPAALRKLPDQESRSIGDTQARRKADLAVLVEDIKSVGGIQPRAQSSTQNQHGSSMAATRVGWLRLDLKTLCIVFALILATGVLAYLRNSPMNVEELLFLFVVFFAFVLAVRWLWGRFRR